VRALVGNKETESYGLGRRAALTMLSVGTLLPIYEKNAFSSPSEAFSEIATTVLGEPVTDPRLLLRNALPVDLAGSPLLEMDDTLLAIGSSSLRSAAGSRSIAQSDMVSQKAKAVDVQALTVSVRRANNILRSSADQILAAIPTSNRSKAESLLSQLTLSLGRWETELSSTPDASQITDLKNDLLNISSQIQGLLVDQSSMTVPEEFASLPQLRGRAVAEMILKEEGRQGQRHIITMVLDGINAPVTAGAFANLVNNGFYNNMLIQRSDGFVVQTGEKTNVVVPTIPMEIKFEGEPEITYGATKDELGLLRKQVVLPFNSLGTMAMARSEFESNSANSQFFFLNKESEVTPSGANVLDGNYAVFGYVVENQDVLNRLKVGDTIESVKLTYGADNIVNPKKI